MSTLSQLISKTRASLTELEVDAEKFTKGNAAAGTRVRNAAREVKVLMQEIRVLVQDSKNSKA